MLDSEHDQDSCGVANGMTQEGLEAATQHPAYAAAAAAARHYSRASVLKTRSVRQESRGGCVVKRSETAQGAKRKRCTEPADWNCCTFHSPRQTSCCQCSAKLLLRSRRVPPFTATISSRCQGELGHRELGRGRCADSRRAT